MRGGIVAIGLIGGLLCACTSGQADPAPTSGTVTSAPVTPSSPGPSTSASTSTTPTGPATTGPNVQPGEKPPVLNSFAKQHTADGAQAFAAYYLKALDWSIATNNTLLIRQIALPSCTACKIADATFPALRAKDEVELGGRIQLRSIQIDHRKYQLEYDYAVRITYREQAVRLRAADGSERTTTPADDDVNSLVFVSWVNGKWGLVNMTAA